MDQTQATHNFEPAAAPCENSDEEDADQDPQPSFNEEPEPPHTIEEAEPEVDFPPEQQPAAPHRPGTDD